MATEVTYIEFDEADADDPERLGCASVDHDGVSYSVRTKSERLWKQTRWVHSITAWCLGEDNAGTERPLGEMPDEVASEVDAALERNFR